jgi:hypothetical protein
VPILNQINTVHTLLYDPFQYYSSIYTYVLLVATFLQVSCHDYVCTNLLYMLHYLSNSFNLSLLTKQNWWAV